MKWGIKIFCVCCSITCYLLNAEFFLGKMSDNEEKKAEDSKTYTMIMRLLKPFRGRNHILHCDDWFTSVKLFQALKEWGIFGCGTIRTSRKDVWDAVKMKKGEESELKKTPRIIRYASRGRFIFSPMLTCPLVIWWWSTGTKHCQEMQRQCVGKLRSPLTPLVKKCTLW